MLCVQVVITTDMLDDVVLHWGVARDEPGQWLLPDKEVFPLNTEAVNDIAVETPFSFTKGCFGGSDECVPLQKVVISIPGDSQSDSPLMGIQFVVRAPRPCMLSNTCRLLYWMPARLEVTACIAELHPGDNCADLLDSHLDGRAVGRKRILFLHPEHPLW